MRYAPWFVAAGLVFAGTTGVVAARLAVQDAPPDAVGFTSAAAQQAQAEFNAEQVRVDALRDKAVDDALSTYRAALNTAKGQALNEKNLPAANQIVAALKAIDTPDEDAAAAEGGKVVAGPPACPESFFGVYQQFEINGKPMGALELRADFTFKREPAEYGVWFVQNNILVVCWHSGATDRYPIPEDPKADLVGVNAIGFRTKLRRP